MSRRLLLGYLFLFIGSAFTNAQPVKAPNSKIKPGEVIIPVGKGEQRLIFGELVSLDLKTRTGSFRNENNDELTPFTVLPYAELQHHAANGDLQDFRIGERALFRLHQDREGKWTWLTYIGDGMSFLINHNSYYWVDALDPEKGEITTSRGNATKTNWGEKGVVMKTDDATRYWQGGKPAAFKDIKVGDKLRTRSHGVGKGKTQVCWDIFLDDESFKKFQEEQRAVHRKRMESEGLSAYIDSRDGKAVKLTLFHETRDVFKTMTPGQKVRLAPAGVDRKPTAAPVTGTVTEIKPIRKVCKVAVTLDAGAEGLSPGLIRLWLDR